MIDLFDPAQVPSSEPVEPGAQRMGTFPITDASSWQFASTETLGSKEKGWVFAPNGDLWLWKSARNDAGDDWAEKLAEQLADLIHLPHAEVSLATRGGARGVLVRDFRVHQNKQVGAFTPGNELLWKANQSYPKSGRRRIAEYTVRASIDALVQVNAGPPITGVQWNEALAPSSTFLGYLLLDAWIGNQDRHHENWGVISMNPAERALGTPVAPSFDHASSLGQNLTDEKRKRRLETRDRRGDLAAWAKKAETPFCTDPSSRQPASTFQALGAAMAVDPAAARLWLGRLEAVRAAQVEAAIASIPAAHLSSVGREFTLRLLETNVREIMSVPRP